MKMVGFVIIIPNIYEKQERKEENLWKRLRLETNGTTYYFGYYIYVSDWTNNKTWESNNNRYFYSVKLTLLVRISCEIVPFSKILYSFSTFIFSTDPVVEI